MDTRAPIGATDGPTILIAEDEALVRLAISDCLAEHGFNVYQAASAAEAIGLLESHSAIDIVFADVCMPREQDGRKLSRWIRTNRPELALLLTSGEVPRRDLLSELAQNEPFFEKPYDLQFVVAYICALSRARASRYAH